jgi:NADH-quinone oxidoreductase subunit C
MADLNSIITKLGAENYKGMKLSEDGKAIVINKEVLIKFLSDLKRNFNYKMLYDITAVEFESNFEMVYHLMTLDDSEILKICAVLSKDEPQVSSVVTVWPSAGVMEREAYDLMGIIFDGQPDLNRILNVEGYKGHPLRKDFKLDRINRFPDDSSL